MMWPLPSQPGVGQLDKGKRASGERARPACLLGLRGDRGGTCSCVTHRPRGNSRPWPLEFSCSLGRQFSHTTQLEKEKGTKRKLSVK